LGKHALTRDPYIDPLPDLSGLTQTALTRILIRLQILHIFILKAIKGEYQCGVHSVRELY